ncbi:MAG: hypothetical protein OEX83_05210 [Gammaproteobacteria bacterium]|nr:hypothetical protein [Gammaproteobacteria bacterium]
MAKPNYSFAKNQREKAKKQKKEAKRLEKNKAQQDEPLNTNEESVSETIIEPNI